MRPSDLSATSPRRSTRPTRGPPPRSQGLEETLTIARLGLSPALIRTFKSTNPIESLNDGIRVMERNVKNWQRGTMTLRWTAVAVLERKKRFRRINGYRDLWILPRALDSHTKEVTSFKDRGLETADEDCRKFYDERDILDVLVSDEWNRKVEEGRWPSQVRPPTKNRRLVLLERAAPTR